MVTEFESRADHVKTTRTRDGGFQEHYRDPQNAAEFWNKCTFIMNQWLQLVRPSFDVQVSNFGHIDVAQCPLVDMLHLHQPSVEDGQPADQEMAELTMSAEVATFFGRNTSA